MTLFRPQDIITLESQINFSLTRFSEIGVNFAEAFEVLKIIKK